MGKSFPRFTSKQTHWIDTKAGRFAILHVCLGACLIFILLWDNTSSLLRNDFIGFMVWMALTVMVAITVFGTLVIYFVARTEITGSERYTRISYWLTIAYLCFTLGVVGISWTCLIGMATVSLVYLAESVMLLVYARRAYRELRADENWASMR